MAHSPQRQSQNDGPRLYLVTPPVEDAAGFARDLAAALEAADAAAVLLRLADADERTQINRIKTIVSTVQDAGAALVLDGHADLVARGGADGAHLDGIEAFSAALDGLKPARIAGCGSLASRHDAMTVAERGADYVMFGDAIDGRRPSLPAIVERITWWAEIFEVPCVALAASLDEVAPLGAAGADFVALADFVWRDPRGAAAAIADARARLAAEAVA